MDKLDKLYTAVRNYLEAKPGEQEEARKEIHAECKALQKEKIDLAAIRLDHSFGDFSGMNLMQLAAFRGDVYLAARLFEAGKDPILNAKGQGIWTESPIYYAFGLTPASIAPSATLYKTDSTGRPQIELSSAHIQTIGFLVMNGADLDHAALRGKVTSGIIGEMPDEMRAQIGGFIDRVFAVDKESGKPIKTTEEIRKAFQTAEKLRVEFAETAQKFSVYKVENNTLISTALGQELRERYTALANHYESALGIQVSGICFTGNESGLGDYFRGANPLQIAAHYGAVLARKDGDKIAYTNPVIEGETARTLAKFPDPWQHAKHMANFTLQGGDGAWSNFTPLHAAMGESHESSSLTLSREVLRNRGANHIAFSGHILDRIAEASESKKIEGPYASRTTEILLRYAGRMLDQQFATTQEKIVGEFAKKGITPHYEASAAIAATLDQHAATAAPTTPTKVNSDTASTALSREAALARQKEALALQGKTVAAMFNEAAKNLPKLEKQKMPWSATPEAKKEQPTAVKTPPPQPMPPQNAAAGNPPVRPAPAPQTLGAMVQTMLALNVALKNGAGGATSQALDAAGANTVMEAAQNLQTILESKKDLSGADLLKDAEVAKAVERFTQENRAFGEKANSAQDPKAQYLIRQMHSLFK